MFCRQSNAIKLRRQRTSPIVSGHLLDDVEVMTRLPASNVHDVDDDTEDVDEHFRDAVYRSVKRSTLADRCRRPRPRSPMRRLLDRPASTDHRAEAVVYRPTSAPEADHRRGGCALCGDTTNVKWTSRSLGDVDGRPDLIEICQRPPHSQTTTTYTNLAHSCCATTR